MLRPSHHRIAIALIALFVAVGVLYSVVVPIFEAPDELYHFPFVAHMAQGGALPVQRPNRGMMWQQEGSQPPLYYFLAGVLTSWIDTSDLPDLYRINPHAASASRWRTTTRISPSIRHANDGRGPGLS